MIARGWRSGSIAALLYAALTIAITYPLITQFTTHVIGGAKLDNYEYVWKLDWVARALFVDRVSPWTIPTIDYPYGYDLAYGEVTPIHTFALAPLTHLIGAIPTYNAIMLGSTWLTAIAVFMLAYRWLDDLALPNNDARWWAAFFAGAAFAFSVSRLLKLTGHLPLVDTHWLAWALLAFDRWQESRRVRWAIAAAVLAACAALSSWYYALLIAILFPVYAVARLGVRGVIGWARTPRVWIGAIGGGAIGIALTLPFLLPYARLNAGGASRVPTEDAAFWSASLTDYLMPNALHPLWGEAVSRVVWPFPSPMITEFVIPVGWTALILVLMAWREARGGRWRGLKWLIAVAILLSLGPVLTFSRLPLGIPMPAALLRAALPIFESIRTWGRFSTLAMLGLCVLASAGMAIALSRVRSRRAVSVIGAALCALMLFESWTGAALTVPVEARPADRWLAAQPDMSPIMEYPLSEALSGPAMYYTATHGKPVTFGYGTYLPFLYRQRHPELLTFPADAALDRLGGWGVRYILVSTFALEYEPFTLADVDTQTRLQHVITLENVRVYELLD